MAIDIALCGDRWVLPGVAVTVRSALESATAPINVHLASAGLTSVEKDRLRRSWDHQNCRAVTFAEIAPGKIRQFRSTAYLKSKVAYARYFLDEMFPDVVRCVYLDADMLVFRDLAETLQMSLDGNIAAAVRDISVRIGRGRHALRLRLGICDERNYFNSGFMVVDLDAWRREQLADKLVSFSIDHFDDLDSQDQDALNVVLENRVLLLDEVWNTSQYEKPIPLGGHVVHLIGPVKPWHARYKAKFRESYYEHVIFRAFEDTLKRTEFCGHPPKDILGLRSGVELAARSLPTRDMLVGKLRRVAKSITRRG